MERMLQLVEKPLKASFCQQLPTWKKAVHFYNYYPTKPKPQAKPKTNLKKQPEKSLRTQNNSTTTKKKS
jgi:hypothetical protein